MRRPWLVLLALAACGVPSVGDDSSKNGLIRGTVVYPAGAKRGNVIITLFAENRLPPPTGSSGPVNFVAISKQRMFGEAPVGQAGDFAAPFTIPNVAPGRYQIRAFLDADEDFNPIYDLLAQPTAGDVGGGFVDPSTRAFRVVEVQANQVSEKNILVSIGLDIPVERPAFAHTATTSFLVPYAVPPILSIASKPIDRSEVKMDPTKTAFLVQFVDENADGAPDDQNGDHLPDVYPRVILRRVAQAGEACQPPACSVIIPAITNPLPHLDALRAAGVALTTRLDLILPPASVKIETDAQFRQTRTISPEVPPGRYETIVISGTGQTWQVPNSLDRIQPGQTDPSQSVYVEMKAGPRAPGGTISGSLLIDASANGDAYVIAFPSANPPPPRGTGAPVALASVPAAAFVDAGGVRTASYTLRGLAAGTYIVAALLDADGDFSPLVSLIAQASGGDFTTSRPEIVSVIEDQDTPGVALTLDTRYPFDRPGFSFAPTNLSRLAPTILEIDAHDLPAVGIDAARFPIMLQGQDADGDNLPDVFPRVLLTRMRDGLDPRLAPNDAERIIVPAIVDPLEYLVPLSAGTPLVSADALRLIVPPIALRPNARGELERFAPIPPGRYRVNVINGFGQTWSVPNDLDLQLGRAGKMGREDPTQAAFVTVAEGGIPGGVIAGEIQLVTAVPAGDFTVVVLAFAEGDPPPPLGTGRPRASALVGKASFAGGPTAAYQLAGLPTGRYEVRAFLDANDNFTAWFDTMNQPDQGDVGGGHGELSPLGLRTTPVAVDALGAPTIGALVRIFPQLRLPIDRPVFRFEGPARLARAMGPGAVEVRAASSSAQVLRANGSFLIRWADLNGDGMADDLNGDRNPDVFPRVLAELLDPDDPSKAASPPRVMPGILNPQQFAALDFPAANPTLTSSVAFTDRLTIIFPMLAVDPANPTAPMPAPAGRYRVTLIQATGQTWSVPNELARATGAPIAASQGALLTLE